MTSQKLIYVIEDERDIAEMVCNELQSFGFATEIFRTGAQASQAIRRRPPVLCIVDLGLPDMDGMALVRELCEQKRIGVMIVTGRGSLPDRVLGLELGADDYLTKPFDPRELVARVNSLIRRLDQIGQPETRPTPKVAQFGDWRFDPATLTLVRRDGHLERLSSAESELLMVLLKAPQQILNRDRLMGDLLGRDSIPYERSIDVRMSRIRKKLEDDPKRPKLIKTVYGVGYLLSVPVDWQAA
ncbi:response regulator transcription factor [Motiliproteus sp.]|uniref:response regulator transcription factor n=1 Tax=Motiliproteus sp. TaxID=1898955 RepID=UPI003BAB2A55